MEVKYTWRFVTTSLCKFTAKFFVVVVMFFTVLARLLLHASVRRLHFMFPTKVAFILISAYWYQFIMNSVRILGVFLPKTVPIFAPILMKFKWKFRAQKGSSQKYLQPGLGVAVYRNPCNNVTASLFHFIHSSKKTCG